MVVEIDKSYSGKFPEDGYTVITSLKNTDAPAPASDREGFEYKRGWVLGDMETIKLPIRKTDYAGKRGRLDFSFDLGLPSGWYYTQRKIADDTYAYATPARAVYDNSKSLLTGRIGTITWYTLSTDRLIEPVVRQSKYVYALTKGKDDKGHHIVQAYLWERDNPSKTYWYNFRSARLAHVHMKKYDTAKRKSGEEHGHQ